MTGPDPHVRTELGAYVLGALEPSERHEVEHHLADCASCREELAELAALPPLLHRLSIEEVTADLDRVRRTLPATVERLGREMERHLRRQVRRWRAAAASATAAAAVLAVVLVAPWASSPGAVVVEVAPVASGADRVQGTVAAYAWEWGTTVVVRVEDLPFAETYAMWTVDATGARERAGSWGPTHDGTAEVRGASAVRRDDLARVEVTGPDGRALFDATFGAAAVPPTAAGGRS